MVTPTAACSAPPLSAKALPHGESNLPLLSRLQRYSHAANLLGYPALTVPVGTDDTCGLPVGLQLMGAHWQEAALLRLGAVMEGAVHAIRGMWHPPTPMVGVQFPTQLPQQ